MKLLPYFAKNGAIALLSLLFSAFILAGVLYFYMYINLPSVDSLKTVQLQVPLRIYSTDGKLIAEYGEVKRIPVTLEQVPKQLIQAIIATEDQRFFEHPGVDFFGLMRAGKELLITGKKTQGASTITMQVARNFFLSRKKTFKRKINEILLAIKINGTLSKDKILELYLNKIYLGQRAYGVGAAAQVYYGKPLNELTLPELAMIAGLPQAPSRDNPVSNPKGAKERRNHVLERMVEMGYIDKQTYEAAIQTSITAKYHGQRVMVSAPYVAEMVRNAVVEEYGTEKAYNAGLKVYTTINPELQTAANQTIRNGLIAYDQRHGYRGPAENLGKQVPEDLSTWLAKLKQMPAINGLIPAVVINVQDRSINAIIQTGETITIPWSGLSWARKAITDQYLGPAPQMASDILQPGDVIRAEQVNGQWRLSQIPKVQGALVSINPNNGSILALVGGFSFDQSHFNRVTQAERQPGSNFKPFIYAAALAKGLTLATIINDAPVVINDYGENNLWRPQNDTKQFYGPTRLKIGLIKSRNLVSIRLLQRIGIPYALNYLQRFGFNTENLPNTLSLALGSADVTPMQIATGFSVFANGGYKITPHFIDHIKNSDGNIIYQIKPPIAYSKKLTEPQPNPQAPQVISHDVAFLITSALQDVIREGTGRGALVLKRSDLAGKTGTTNDQVDAWFSGYTRNLVTTVWVGFDQPNSIYEYGAQAALPIWINFMRTALKGVPEQAFPEPSNIISVRIDPESGLLATPGQKNALFEVFREQYAPTISASNNDRYQSNEEDDTNLTTQLF